MAFGNLTLSRQTLKTVSLYKVEKDSFMHAGTYKRHEKSILASSVALRASSNVAAVKEEISSSALKERGGQHSFHLSPFCVTHAPRTRTCGTHRTIHARAPRLPCTHTFAAHYACAHAAHTRGTRMPAPHYRYHTLRTCAWFHRAGAASSLPITTAAHRAHHTRGTRLPHTRFCGHSAARKRGGRGKREA